MTLKELKVKFLSISFKTLKMVHYKDLSIEDILKQMYEDFEPSILQFINEVKTSKLKSLDKLCVDETESKDIRHECKTFSGWAKFYRMDKDNAYKKAKKKSKESGLPLGVKIGNSLILTPQEAKFFFENN